MACCWLDNLEWHPNHYILVMFDVNHEMEPAVVLLDMDELPTTAAAPHFHEICVEAAQAGEGVVFATVRGQDEGVYLRIPKELLLHDLAGALLAHLTRFAGAVIIQTGVLDDAPPVGCEELVRTLQAVRQLSGDDALRFNCVAEGLRLEDVVLRYMMVELNHPLVSRNIGMGGRYVTFQERLLWKRKAVLSILWEHVFGADSGIEAVFKDICSCAFTRLETCLKVLADEAVKRWIRGALERQVALERRGDSNGGVGIVSGDNSNRGGREARDPGGGSGGLLLHNPRRNR